MDIFSKGIERRIPKVNVLWRWLFKMEWKRLLNYEAAVFNNFNSLTIISRQDRDLLPLKDPSAVHVIANGVDTDFFHPIPADKDYELLFTIDMKDYEKLQHNPDVTFIGHITAKEGGVNLVTRSNTEHPIKAQGWDALMGNNRLFHP